MKRLASVVLVLVVACVGQQARSTAHGQAFQWNWRTAQTADAPLSVHKNVSSADRAALLQEFATQFRNLAAQNGQVTESTRNERSARAAETRVMVIDLNGDRVSEVIAQPVGDICSPTGNCPFWVFQKTASGYRLILDEQAIQTFNLQPTRTNGYRDLVLGRHGSATQKDLLLYQYRDGQYQQTACYDAEWSYLDANGEMRDLEKPRIAPCQDR